MKTSKKRLPKSLSLAAFAKSLDLDRERRDALERVVALWETGPLRAFRKVKNS
jgi:hypothetical protein